MMNKLIYILLGALLVACQDELNVPASGGESNVAGRVLRFEVVVEDGPHSSRGQVLDVYDNYITRDFNPRDSFGMFIIDAEGNFVTEIDGHNALNIRVTTPDGVVWNLNSDIKDIVHKLGYKYVAYYPYSETFNDCATVDNIRARLTPPAADQSTQPAIDWMYTEPTAPQVNAVTTLRFKHRYAKIDIYNSFTQDHQNSWASAYQYTRTVDNNGVEHYRYIVDAATPQTLTVSGTYSIGNELTGIKQLSYRRDDVEIVNGRHAIVYTYRMDERCAVDLGFPSGVRWSPINLGAETASYMTDAELAAAATTIGRRLAWGELFEKDNYSYETYINDPYQSGSAILPADISETVYDPVRQYWGGHWTLPTLADLQEFINYTEIVSTESVYSEELRQNVNKITFRSTVNGKTITMVTTGYANNTSVAQPQYLHYMSASRAGTNYCSTLNNNPSLQTYNNYRYLGFGIRPVLKELFIHPNVGKTEIVISNIDSWAVDLGITKVVDGVTYKLLWSPFNYGADTKIDVRTYNRAPISADVVLNSCITSLGGRYAWGDTVEPAYFNTNEYKASDIAKKYNYSNDGSESCYDYRDLKPEDDIVQTHWPSGWYIPTMEDYRLLAEGCTISYDGRWFTLTSKSNGNTIRIPANGYIDDKANLQSNAQATGIAFLQSCTIGAAGTKPTCFALQLSSSTYSINKSAGRPTGLMIRPVRYVRVD